MSVSASTSRALHQTLGDDAADEVVNLINQMESSRSEFRDLIELTLARHEDRMALKFSEFRQDVRDDIARLDVKIERRYADVMKWSLVYWLGAVGAIATLARVLR